MIRPVIAVLAALALALGMVAGAETPGLGGVSDMSGIAAAADMTDVTDIVPEGLSPVTANQLSDGTWPVAVESSSSMFEVVGCDLTVTGGKMTATLYMKSDAYSHMYPGPAEAAAGAQPGALCPLEILADGRQAFTLPVDRLDAGYACAAFSARKRLWYPRTLLFRSDSLPLEAWRPERLCTAETLGLADGRYRCDVTLSGGGRTTLQSPARLTVSGGACVADIAFSTARIDYVIVGGERFEPTSTEGGAAFAVPVAAFDRGLSIVVDSTAIIPAVELDCSMTFDASTLSPE